MTEHLYAPPDLAEAAAAWKANCGPACLAACIGKPLEYVRPFFPGFAGRVNPGQMALAIGAAGYEAVESEAKQWRYGDSPAVYRVAFVQFDGGSLDGKPNWVLYDHTHWVATFGSSIYDHNAGAWIDMGEWEAMVLPELLKANGAGSVWCRVAYEVRTWQR